MNTAIETQDLVKRYGSRRALDGLTLSVPRFAVLGLIGPNGAGKTTWMMSVTFRAAGTSLSGQAIGEGILLILGHDGFRKIEVSSDAKQITLGAAVIGSDANAALAPLNRKIGPDPATIAWQNWRNCWHNASGMCCGTAQKQLPNSIASAKLLFADGTELDTGCEKSKAEFAKTHGKGHRKYLAYFPI